MLELNMLIFISAIVFISFILTILLRMLSKETIKKGHFIQKENFLEDKLTLKMKREESIIESLKSAQELSDVEKLVACVISDLSSQDLEDALEDSELPKFERDLCINEKYYRNSNLL